MGANDEMELGDEVRDALRGPKPPDQFEIKILTATSRDLDTCRLCIETDINLYCQPILGWRYVRHTHVIDSKYSVEHTLIFVMQRLIPQEG